VDAAQAAGKVEIDLAKTPSTCCPVGPQILRTQGHRRLYVRRKPRVRLEAQIHGGGHERGLRSGTLPTRSSAWAKPTPSPEAAWQGERAHPLAARSPVGGPLHHGGGVSQR
jgi:hypothetical protein